jgi:hypothetical protein
MIHDGLQSGTAVRADSATKKGPFITVGCIGSLVIDTVEKIVDRRLVVRLVELVAKEDNSDSPLCPTRTQSAPPSETTVDHNSAEVEAKTKYNKYNWYLCNP